MSGLTTNYDLMDAASKYQIPLLGVYSKDKIPKYPLRSGGMIFNLEDSTGGEGGTHWVSIFFNPSRKKAIYFDPFGFQPPTSVIEAFKDFLPIEFSSVQVQNPQSTVCGYYCLFFIWYISQDPTPSLKKRLSNFIQLFNATDPAKNLQLLKQYFKNAF